jgi:hypothetical protein
MDIMTMALMKDVNHATPHVLYVQLVNLLLVHLVMLQIFFFLLGQLAMSTAQTITLIKIQL